MDKLEKIVANIEDGLTEFKLLTDQQTLPEHVMSDVLSSLQHLQDELDTLQLSIRYPRKQE